MEGNPVSTFLMVLFIVVAVLAGIFIALYFLGKRVEKKQQAQQEQMDAVAQTVSLLVIDKKKMRLKNAGLPAVVMEAAPRMAKIAKVPVVKAKVGPKVTTLLCDEKVFEVLPLKRECKVVVSGIYITAIKSARGGLEQVQKKKKGFFGRRKAAGSGK